MTANSYRRACLALAAVVALASPALAAPGVVTPDDMTLGSPTAPVTVFEYTSVACRLCADFNNKVLPDFWKKYIATGKVRYVLRETLTGNVALAAQGVLLARCAGKDKYFKAIDALFHVQGKMYQADTNDLNLVVLHDGLSQVAQDIGISEDQMEKCLVDPVAIEALNRRATSYPVQDKIAGTPTFVINGKKYEGAKSLAELDAVLQPLLK